jgi:flagellar hook-associated protein 2
MEVEKIPLVRMEEKLDTYKVQKTAIQDVNRKIQTLRDNSRKLYGFENPFNSKIAESSNEDVLTATAGRQALNEERKLAVKQLAYGDKFLSKQLASDYQVPEGLYSFSVGDKKTEFKFKGGSITDFADAVNRRTQGLLNASIVKNTSSSSVFIIEALKTGEKNQLSFHDEALKLAIDLGIVEKSRVKDSTIILSNSVIQRLTLSEKKENYSIEGNTLSVNPLKDIRIKPDTAVSGENTLQLDFTITDLPRSADGPALAWSPPESSRIDFKGITIINQPSESTAIPEFKKPQPVFTENSSVIYLLKGNEKILLPQLDLSASKQQLNIKISDYTDSFDTLLIENGNSNKKITLNSAIVKPPSSDSGYVPVNSVTRAQDAIIKIDGINIKREKNEIDDVIPGVTLNLKDSSEKEIRLKIGPDKEQIKEDIITFVGNYNRLVTELQVLTRNNPEILESSVFVSDDEREKAEKRLGLFQGDSTFQQLRSRLQTIMMNPYPVNDTNTIALAAQAGISTNASGAGASVDAAKLRGFLEIKEESLDSIIENKTEQLKYFFGSDQDGDLIIDAGLAFTAEAYLRAFSETGGIMPLKIATIDNQVKQTNKQIDDMKIKLEKKEADLKRKYGMMEGALGNLEKNSEALKNFSSGNK